MSVYLHQRKWKLRLGDYIGPPDCPLMRRWIAETPWFSVRLHHFLRSDDHRHMHDHPWPFVTLVLRGGYVDVSLAGRDELRPGSVRYRPALWTHYVETENAWTIIVTGPILRVWGFLVDGRRQAEESYFAEFGFAACADIDATLASLSRSADAAAPTPKGEST